MLEEKNELNTTKTKRVFPRISADWYTKLSVIAEKRGQNLSELTRDLYSDLIRREFPSNQKPAA
jgi:hypothetical protein